MKTKDEPYVELQGGAYVRDAVTGERRRDPEQHPEAAQDQPQAAPAKPKKGE